MSRPIPSLLILFGFLITPFSASSLSSTRPCPNSSLSFCNSSLSISARAEALISLLTLDEKIKQLSDHVPAIPRLGLSNFIWWGESLHGVANIGPGLTFNNTIPAATTFPQVIVMAASYNKTLWKSVARVIGVEARAMYNSGMAGLSYWAPNINIFRDPRWGRGQETPGEDPLVASSYAIEYVKGFQNEDDDGGLMVSACCKHLVAYDMEHWNGFDRFTFNAKVTEQDMEDTFLPPFKSCVQEGNASCLMCSYNEVNGLPACANKDLFQQARDEWGFEGYITSDCDSVKVLYENQTYSDSPEDAAAAVLLAGMDIECGTYLVNYTKSAIENGKVNESDIDRALKNLFSVQMRLGLFNQNISFTDLRPANVCSSEHTQLSLEASRQGIVLLKNENGLLPLNKSRIGSVAVVGPAGNSTADILLGDYSGIACNSVSFYEGIKKYISNTTFAAGCNNVSCNSTNTTGFPHAIKMASETDIVVMIMGLNLTEETEGVDRTSLLLPGKQEELVKKIANVTKMPLVLVLTGGGPVDVSFAKNNSNIGAIIWVGYPGEAGGQALAEVLFGDYNPGAKLPVTWYPESFTNISMTVMNMRPNTSSGYPGRTYRFYTGDPVYKFGYGLSYSNLSYKITKAPNKISLSMSQSFIRQKLDYFPRRGFGHVYISDLSSTSCDALKFYVRSSVYNHGSIAGSHAVLLFVRPRSNLTGHPVKQLVGFERMHSRAGEATEIKIFVDPCKHMSVADEQGKRVLLLGTHVFMLEDVEHEVLIEVS